jgi:hypothetical protein
MARYIDADALIKEMQESKYANPCNDFQRGVNASIDIQITGIKHMPTADVAPKSEVVNILSDLKKEIHDKAVYPHLSGVEPYISLKVFDAVINKLIGS